MSDDTRARLERFMRKYNPEKLSTIDSILKAYAGKEEQMFETLTKKYGPEPPREDATPPASVTGASASPEDPRTRLERFMRKYNPEKLSTIDSILKAYAGKEEQMFQTLTKKYGPEPPREDATPPASVTGASASPEDPRTRLERFMRKYNPEKLSTIDSILKAYAGKEEQMFQTLTKKYGPEPPREDATPPASVTGASASPEDPRTRLERFMRKYNPEKLSTIDSILKAYAGKEDQMFQALTKKYGPEPPREDATPPASATGASTGPEDTRTRLERFMRKYNPEKLSTIDSILKAYAGKEDQMFQTLTKKYGPEPSREDATPPVSATGASTGPEDTRTRLERFMRKYNPEKLSTIDSILKAYAGKEEQMFEALTKKYGPEPPREDATPPASVTGASASPEDTRTRLERFMRKYNPEKLSTIDSILKAYAGKEEQMFQTLTKKYGPEPPREDATPPASVTGASASPEDTRTRLERFMRKYNPEKLSTIDSILKAYAGKEDQMFQTLTKKYGPEPPRDTISVLTSVLSGESTTFANPSVGSSAASPKDVITSILNAYGATYEDVLLALPREQRRSIATGKGSFTLDPPARCETESARTRLERFMRKYNPEKLSTIDSILKAYAGKEEQMFQTLTKKYGPEPPREDATPPASVTGASTGPEDTRTRLERFMRKYNPEKLSTIDSILKAYAGKEEQMFETLTKKYGPEPPREDATPPASVTGASASPEDPRTRLERFMRKYNPEKLSTIDSILKAYAGKEDQMFQTLTKKYGPEPSREDATPPVSATGASTGPEDTRTRLERFMRKYNPEKLSAIDSILKAYAGKEDQMFQTLTKKYGPEPSREDATPPASATGASTGPEDTRTRLERFMRKYNPEKLSTIDSILKAYAGKEDQMFQTLTKKYGPEPPREDATPPVSATGASTGPEDTRTRLERFMRKYNPEKLSAIDSILKAYAGNEEQMFETLTKKYGPEPPREDAAPSMGSGSVGVEDRVSSSEYIGKIFNMEAAKARLSRFMLKYTPEKLAGVDALAEATGAEGFEALIANLVAVYGPEPEEDSESAPANMVTNTEELPVVDEREELSLWLSERGLDAQSCCYAAISEAQLLAFVREKFGDYDGRLRRLFVRYDPSRIEGVPVLLASNRGAEDALLARLVAELGPEPERTAPTSLVRLISRRADLRRIDEETWTDEEEGDDGEPLAQPPEVWREGRSLVAEFGANDPGEFSGDEAAAYPRDEEYWYRLFLTNAGFPSVASQQEIAEPTFDSPKTNSQAPHVRVTLGNRYGQVIGSLCRPCGDNIARSFEALWQPIGPQYMQLLSETVVKDGYLEKLSSGGRRMGVKWQKRYFRVNDKGLHYYETDAPNERPKGYKIFTKHSTVVDHVDPTVHPKCAESHYHYFIITINNSNELFYLRTPNADEKKQWVSFLQLAVARARLTSIGQDQNPARWRARMKGLRDADIGLLELVQASSTVLEKQKKQCEEMRERIKTEASERELMETQIVEMQKQQSFLSQCIAEAKEKSRLTEEEIDAKCLEYAAEAAAVKQQRLEMESNLEETRRMADGIMQTVIKLQCDIVDLEKECDLREARVRRTFSKWRRCEERSPSLKAICSASSPAWGYAEGN